MAKIIGTLKPTKILLVDTKKYSEEKALNEKAQRVIDLYKQHYKLDESSISESINNDNDKPEDLLNTIIVSLKKISLKNNDTIYINITGGKAITSSILALMSLEIIKRFEQEVFICYCDYDSQSIIYYAPQIIPEYKYKKVHLDFAANNLEDRIGITNSSLKDTYTICLEKFSDKNTILKDKRLKLLSNEINQFSFRKIFNSSNEIVTKWIIENEIPKKRIKFNFKKTVKRIVVKLFRSALKKDTKDRSYKKVTSFLIDSFEHAGLNYKNKYDLLSFFSNEEFDNAFKNIAKNGKDKLINYSGIEYDNNKKAKNAITKFLNKFKLSLLEEINLLSLYVNKELISPNPPQKYYYNAISDYCEHNAINETSIEALHLKENSRLSFLFENIVSYTISEIVKNDSELYDRVKGIYSNVSLSESTQLTSIEFDVLIMLNDGNFINYEVKQHHSAAKTKDLDARSKNQDKILGPKTISKIVFPIFESDIIDQSIDNHNEWFQKIEEFKKKDKEYRVVYFDKLKEELKKDIL